jgi:ribokinase
MAHNALAPKVFVLGNFVQACCWMVPRLPLPGETLVATGVHIEAGGKGLNVAICLQRLGAQVSTLIGCGDDAAGAQLRDLLQSEGLDATHVHTLPGTSGWGSGWIGADGINAIAVYPGANLLLTAQHATQAHTAIAQAGLVYGQFETSIAAVEASFAYASQCGQRTVLNPSPWQTPSAVLRSHTDIVIVNEVEALSLLALPQDLPSDAHASARTIAQAAPALWQQWPALRTLVVTLGALGSVGFDKAQATHYTYAPALPVHVVDTVGAGDAFASGYCSAMLAGHSLAQALVWGNLCGAHVASRAGVLQALPDAAQLQILLAHPQVPQAVVLTLEF